MLPDSAFVHLRQMVSKMPDVPEHENAVLIHSQTGFKQTTL